MKPPRLTSANIVRFGVIAAFAAIAVFTIMMMSWSLRVEPGWLQLVRDHFPVVVGLPMAALASFVVVIALKHTSGPVEFKALGFEFKGSSGQIAMWIACYLVIVISIQLLWKS
jgi:hypothetical protein